MVEAASVLSRMLGPPHEEMAQILEHRAWHEEVLIDVAAFVTRMHHETSKITDEAWNEFIARHPEHAGRAQTVNYRTTTTANYEKARDRVLRGDLGTCPILVAGIGEATWDGTPFRNRV